jgi:F-type H+-transporting ATPase subunit epsilon
MTFQVTIAKIDDVLFDGSAVSVTVPGVEGEMTVLPDHQPLISELKDGVITVRPAEGPEQFFNIKRGVLEVTPKNATVLV